MVEFIVYGISDSPYLRSVLIALEEKAAAWRLVPLDRGAEIRLSGR
jgi:glutathione S-transferase